MCKCQQGYSGKNCQINNDDCAGDPCQNNGVCVDGIQSYSCTCPAGYSGKNCEVAIDHCVGQPCANGGTCTNTPTGYTCSCMPSYYGCRCTKGRAQIFFPQAKALINSCPLILHSRNEQFLQSYRLNALLCSVIGQEWSHHFLNQSDTKLQLITT